MEELIQKALRYSGYPGKPTEENLIECFLDYVDCSQFANLDLDEAKDLIEEGEITVSQMCYNLINLRR